jgi:hypothetical protein
MEIKVEDSGVWWLTKIQSTNTDGSQAMSCIIDFTANAYDWRYFSDGELQEFLPANAKHMWHLLVVVAFECLSSTMLHKSSILELWKT